jgi:hydroxymethylpyrimidine pyrophosphatase-like HAD family hydrolase
MTPKVVYVDVDDTLVRSLGSKRSPMRSVIEQVKRLHAEGAEIYLWSTGGAQYAKEAAAELGITACCVGFLPKPHLYIDDQAVHEWRGCKHILPGNAGDA